MMVSGLYAGIGGFELGFERSGHRTLLMSEIDPDALRVIRNRFSHVEWNSDVVKLSALPEETDVVTAGFPCQNLSMAGRKQGIRGEKTRVVDALFPAARSSACAVGGWSRTSTSCCISRAERRWNTLCRGLKVWATGGLLGLSTVAPLGSHNGVDACISSPVLMAIPVMYCLRMTR